MIELQSCDFGIVGPDRKGIGQVIGEAICFVESREVLGSPKYDHAFFVLQSNGLILNTVWPSTRKANLSLYVGHRVLLGRYRYLSSKGRQLALALAETFVGRPYPLSRLLFNLVGLGTHIGARRGDCSETTIRLLYAATGCSQFKEWFGWMPSDLADVIRNWSSQFEVVFDGVLQADDLRTRE